LTGKREAGEPRGKYERVRGGRKEAKLIRKKKIKN